MLFATTKRAAVAAAIALASESALAADGVVPWLDEVRVGGAASANGGSYNGFLHAEALLSPVPPVATYNPYFAWLLSPRPLAGVKVSLQGRTNEAFAGFAWTLPIPSPFVVEVSISGLVHDQDLYKQYPDRPELTSRFMFREAITVGYEISPRWRVLAFADHDSIANLGYRNLSVNHVGVMLGAKLGDSSNEPPPPPPPPISTFSWSGPYVGASAGVATGQFAYTIRRPPTFESSTTQSDLTGIFGVQAGFNWAIGRVVAGVEGDVSVQGVTADVVYPTPIDNQTYARSNWLATARARLGVDIEQPYLINRFLLYGTGGAAFARIAKSYCQDGPNCFVPGGADIAGGWTTRGGVHTGWTAGAGVEIPLAAHVTAKLEYLYANFGKISYANGPNTNEFELSESILRAGLNIKFFGN